MHSTEQPVICGIERSGLDNALEMVALVRLAAMWGMTLYSYPQLPNVIPRHFNASGEPDAWGSKGAVFILPIISLAVYASLTALSRRPHRFNYPWPITQQNARKQYTLAQQMLRGMKATIVFIFVYIVWASLETAFGHRQGLGAWFLPAAVASTILVIIAYFTRACRAIDSGR